ncbi:vWA domain-containing protein [Dyadobacter pollutisoli]|uniref:VWA domain-containing protein n=1 Tax=Dyadobacter pollutisoli TaxID=2910158 RepID=A0A9E8NHU1_9BACT|nr:VWA domain-containing protein [Dyadobacter pollutisoli]WAC15246.1 VWA domain-containing protein [Dyadobacter pollutisoli]
MRPRLLLLFIFTCIYNDVWAQQEASQQSLNHYVEFLSKSADEVTDRFKMLRDYQEDANRYRKKPDLSLRLPSSGPLEEFYYNKALEAKAVTTGERQQLNAAAKSVWDVLNKLDETGKALETHVRLNAYKDDNLKKSDALVSQMQSLFGKFSKDKAACYQQIQSIYHRYQPYSAADPYLATEREMEEVLRSQQQLLDSLPFYLNEESRFEWPVAKVQQSMLRDEKVLADFGKLQSKLAYPASDMVGSFKSALSEMQSIKSHAIDDHNFAAKQSARHGNEVYISLMNRYNQDLLVNHKAFINYSNSARRMLDYPAFSPIFAPEPSSAASQKITKTPPFQDKPLATFNVKKASSPPSAATVRVLNDYVEYINESLRQMHLMQVLIRNYQSSAEYYRDPARAQKRANLTYAYDDFKVPVAVYQLLLSASTSVPQPYRAGINTQAEVLLNVLKEMDGLSAELVAYTTEKQYVQDQLSRSDAILDRYAILFDVFDQKKEQLYKDVRRIHESYPNANAASSWYVAGEALLKTMDNGREGFFGVKDFLKSEKSQLPETDELEKDAKQLIADEYQNMKGLKRYGRSNGLCPYSPYEDLAANSLRFAETVPKVKMPSAGTTRHPFESFYYFYNNELVYQYNKFIELANAGLLKMINQPDIFTFRRLTPQKPDNNPPKKIEVPLEKPAAISERTSSEPVKQEVPVSRAEKPVVNEAAPVTVIEKDTVYVERVRVDTVYVDRAVSQEHVTRSLEGFAPNNMVLLLDVSSSMNSPFKMPLLKRSIKSLLTLLRAEDQISIVLYSGKARVVLKPTSGSKAAEIARQIDLLQSDGDTDGNEGIRLAYKVANKEYIRGGNNRIVLATDGEFPVSDEVMQMIGENARQDVYLTIFTFGRNAQTGQRLKKLSQLGQGTYAHVTAESADLQLILEAQAKKQVAK